MIYNGLAVPAGVSLYSNFMNLQVCRTRSGPYISGLTHLHSLSLVASEVDVSLREQTSDTIWRTQVFCAILERRCILESERGSACVTRETQKQRGAWFGRVAGRGRAFRASRSPVHARRAMRARGLSRRVGRGTYSYTIKHIVVYTINIQFIYI